MLIYSVRARARVCAQYVDTDSTVCPCACVWACPAVSAMHTGTF